MILSPLHLGRHRFPRSAVSHPQGAHPRVFGRLHRSHYPGRIALFESLLQRCVQIGRGCLLATSSGVFARSGIPLAATTTASDRKQYHQPGYEDAWFPHPLARFVSKHYWLLLFGVRSNRTGRKPGLSSTALFVSMRFFVVPEGAPLHAWAGVAQRIMLVTLHGCARAQAVASRESGLCDALISDPERTPDPQQSINPVSSARSAPRVPRRPV